MKARERLFFRKHLKKYRTIFVQTLPTEFNKRTFAPVSITDMQTFHGVNIVITSAANFTIKERRKLHAGYTGLSLLPSCCLPVVFARFSVTSFFDATVTFSIVSLLFFWPLCFTFSFFLGFSTLAIFVFLS